MQTKPLHSFTHLGNETDHAALLAIKTQLVNHFDPVFTSWNNSIHHCDWEGITCGSKHKRVTIFDLNSRGLSGTISPFIGNLTFLKIILLYNNSIYGRIPASLGHLFRLQTLILLNNTLSGEIPANISGCINLSRIQIQFNNLDGKLPAGLKSLSKLEYLSVNSNYFTGNPFTLIQNLTSLQTIATTYNSFTGNIPNNIGRMTSLMQFAVAVNRHSGTLPVSLFNLSSIQILELGGNQFHGELPKKLQFDSSNLIWLNFADNNFSGPIPEVENYTNLKNLVFEGNKFTGKVSRDFRKFHYLNILSFAYNFLQDDINFITALVNCTQLRTLDLRGNHFYGVLPESIANFSTSLTRLTLGDSLTTWIFSDGITNLVNLQYLYMGNSGLTSSIPNSLGKMYKLEYLALNSNRLTGKIPECVGNLSFLSKLYLEHNRLESIPESIENCESLLYFNLSDNRFSGELNRKLFTGSAKYVAVDLSDNRFEGQLEISKQSSLGSLKLSNNKFSGLLPDGLRECTDIQFLDMDGNSFQGDIPSSYVSLFSLQKADFLNNNLSGPIPAFFGKILSLYYLNLSYNDFQGIVPKNSVFGNASGIFVFGNNRLCGGIPELHLPKCSQKRKKREFSHIIKLIIPITIAVFGFLVIIAILMYLKCIKKKKTSISSDSMILTPFAKVSYDMLLKATNGFSSDSLLGLGSFGSVYKGNLDGKIVAVKVFNLEHHVASKSFLVECKALRNVRHRNLVGIITACLSSDFQGNDFKALVYEFMPNGSLDDWLKQVVGNNLSVLQRAGVAIDVANAVNYLHHECETPIVHCDLKPRNILLDSDMVACVGDFGLARILTQPRHPNQSSTIGITGTIGYAPPEYGLGSETSTAGDIYSYGILLLELITGKSPVADMFKEDYNLHMYAEEALLHNQVVQIIDPSLNEHSLTEEADDRREIQDENQRQLECIIEMITVGVSCSNYQPQDRMKINDAISTLQSARDRLLNIGRRQNLPLSS